MISRRRAIIWVVVLVLLTNFATFSITTGKVPWLARWAPGLVPSANLSTPAFQDFFTTLQLIKQYYVEPQSATDENKLIYGAIAGMASSLDDPYTMYFTPSEVAQFNAQTTGSYAGIGVEVQSDLPTDQYITVVAVFPNTPAEAAGLQPGDKIVAVDKQDIAGVPIDTVSSEIMGPVGTKVTLGIVRNGGQPFDVTITRAEIQLPTVEAKMLTTTPEKIGYLRLYQFSSNAPALVSSALQSLQNQGMQALVLDLRDDPGGFLDAAVAISAHFVPAGPVVRILSRIQAPQTLNSAGPGFSGPLVVLVNGGTASAAEILTGAIMDRTSDVVVGSKTFGKGVVQTVFPLNRGELKITFAQYLTPDGTSINKVGIMPDVVVHNVKAQAGQPPVRFSNLADPRNAQLIRAVQILQQKLAHPGT